MKLSIELYSISSGILVCQLLMDKKTKGNLKLDSD